MRNRDVGVKGALRFTERPDRAWEVTKVYFTNSWPSRIAVKNAIATVKTTNTHVKMTIVFALASAALDSFTRSAANAGIK